MLGKQIKGIINYIAGEIDKLEEYIELIDGERVILGDRVVHLEAERSWMRREVERVGRALFTGTKTGYVGTEEDLHTIGQTVEGVCDTNSQLFDILEAAQNEIDGCPFCKRGMECKTTHYKLREAIGKLWKEN